MFNPAYTDNYLDDVIAGVTYSTADDSILFHHAHAEAKNPIAQKLYVTSKGDFYVAVYGDTHYCPLVRDHVSHDRIVPLTFAQAAEWIQVYAPDRLEMVLDPAHFKTAVVTIRVPALLKRQLEAQAKVEKCSLSEMAAQVLKDWI